MLRMTLLWLWLLISTTAAAADHPWHGVIAPKDYPLDETFTDVPRYHSITQALDALALLKTSSNNDERNNDERHYLAIAPGDYYEKVLITTATVSLIGFAERPRIVFDAYAGMAGHFHPEGWGTPGSATLTVRAPNVVLNNLHIENSFDFISNDARSSDDPERIRDAQAVALLIDGNGDNTRIMNSRIDGYQDTVFVDAGKSYFENTQISGNVDFIFGSGFALFYRCDIISRIRGREFTPGSVQGHITAPSTSIKQPWGLVFINSRLLREEGVPDNSVSLGRPWHPTRTFADGRYADPEAIGSAIYINTWMDAHIRTEGWASMAGTAADGSRSLLFTPADSRFFEINSNGPGAHQHPERRALPQADKKRLRQLVN